MKGFLNFSMATSESVGLISIRGLPASYGAFEQTASQLSEFLLTNRPNLTLFVGCTNDVFIKSFEQKNVVRKSFKRGRGLGTILYGLKTVLWCYKKGCRKIIVFGYALAPFFFFFELFGIKIICNVDGIEWKRDKWSKLAKFYFGICEVLAVKSNAELVYDSFNIERYYSIKHSRKGNLIFYGSENFEKDKLNQTFLEVKNKYGLEQNNYYTCVMRLEPENNIKMIVKGFIKSKNQDKLIIIGPETPYFLSEIVPLIDKCNNIDWIGPIYDRLKLMSIRYNAFGYIHGHKVGGTNPTLVEAIHLDSKIFAFKSIFNKELVSKDCLFGSEDELVNLLENSTPREIPHTNINKYSWETVCSQYLQLMEKL